MGKQRLPSIKSKAVKSRQESAALDDVAENLMWEVGGWSPVDDSTRRMGHQSEK